MRHGVFIPEHSRLCKWRVIIEATRVALLHNG
jgi:hypothetical protein